VPKHVTPPVLSAVLIPHNPLVKNGFVRMEWTQERVIEFIDRYKKQQIIWNPKHLLHFNKTKKKAMYV
jgi:hypothetical protein